MLLLALADPKNGLDHRTALGIPGGFVDLVDVVVGHYAVDRYSKNSWRQIRSVWRIPGRLNLDEHLVGAEKAEVDVLERTRRACPLDDGSGDLYGSSTPRGSSRTGGMELGSFSNVCPWCLGCQD